MSIKSRLETVTGGEAVAPLSILFGLNLVDEFDRIAFAGLLPEIRDHFDLTDAQAGAITVLTIIFVLLAALPMGVIADRFNRVRMSALAALVWGTMSIATGIVPAVGLLIIVRLLAGLGRVANDIVHPSLLGDYYKPENQPRVFLVHRLANSLGAGSAILSGTIGALLGWQWAFILLSIPTFLLLAGVVKLREPARGESVDAERARDATGEPPVPPAEARRQLFAIRTLRRLYLGSFLLGVGFISIAPLLSFFFEKVYGFGPFERGLVQFVFGLGGIAGLFIGGRLATRAIEAGNMPRLATLTGLSFVTGAAGLILMGLAPWAYLSRAFAFVVAAGFTIFVPAYYPIVGLVAPPRVRSQSFSYSLLCIGFGGVLGAGLLGIGDSAGYRPATAILSCIIAIAGFVGMSASKFVARDIEQATNSLAAAQQMRDELAQTGERALLACRRVEVAYDQVQVLFGVDMEVRPGEIVALLGTNGAGKSTLLKAISGTVDPIGGAIYFDGRDITHADANATVAAGVVQVPGGKAVFPTLTVQEHLRAAGWLYRSDPEHLRTATNDVLETFPRLRERIDQMAGNLSGGEQQMLALGMAFIAKPKLLMIDELSLGLAPTIVEQLLGIVRRIRDNGTAIILVEQSINVALTLAERAYFLEKGEVRFEGPTADLLERDDIVRSVFLQGASSVDTGSRDRNGTEVHRSGTENVIGEPILEVRDLVKRFGGIRAVDDATFTLHSNEILGLIGPNGAGKTTIFDLVSGFLVPDGGRIVLEGLDVTHMRPDRRAWLGLGRSFQDARLVPSLTVAENLAIGLERHIDVRDPVASALGLPGIVQLEEDVAWTVEDLIEMMNLGAFRDKFVRELSTGSRRIVDLAMCIAHDPKVLLLDEPSSGIAQRETEALGPLLLRIKEETGCALLVIEHDMPLITSVSDRMIALELGHPIVEGTPTEVTTDPRVVSSYLGGDLASINRSGATAASTEKPNAKPKPRRRTPITAGDAS
jgi:ABC-type branched-subunit amino acid transport system ATPase component/predicted MFS family arabinose efflux permease